MAYFGSPGISVSDLSEQQVFSGASFYAEAKWDGVGDIGAFGGDPSGIDGMRFLQTGEAHAPDGTPLQSSSGHSAYLADRTTSQYNLAQLVAGHPERAIEGRNVGFLHRPDLDDRPLAVLMAADRTRRAPWLTAAPTRLAALTVIAVSGCTVGGSTMTPEDQLRQRGTYAAAEQGYLALLTEARTALSELVPSLAWKTGSPTQAGTAMCRAPFTDVAGAVAGLFDSGSASGGVPDAVWPQVRDRLGELARAHGFTTSTVVVDAPGDRAISWHDDYGAELSFGTQQGTTVAIYGACFLRSGGPTP